MNPAEFLTILPWVPFRKIIRNMHPLMIFGLSLAFPKLSLRLKRAFKCSEKRRPRIILTFKKNYKKQEYEKNFESYVLITMNIKFRKVKNSFNFKWKGDLYDFTDNVKLKYRGSQSRRHNETFVYNRTVLELLSFLCQFFNPVCELACIDLPEERYPPRLYQFLRLNRQMLLSAKHFECSRSQWLWKNHIFKGKELVMEDIFFTPSDCLSILQKWKSGKMKHLETFTFNTVESITVEDICVGIGAMEWDPTKRDKLYVSGISPNLLITDYKEAFDLQQDETGKIATLFFENDTIKMQVWECPFPAQKFLDELIRMSQELDEYISNHLPSSCKLVRLHGDSVLRFEDLEGFDPEGYTKLTSSDRDLVNKMIKLGEVNRKKEELELMLSDD